MNREEYNTIVTEVTRRCQLPMASVMRVISEYTDIVTAQCEMELPRLPAVPLGVLTYDAHAALRPGITVIYSQSDMGKTSFAKRVAMSCTARGLSVLYIDTECKLYLHDRAGLQGVVFADAERWSAIMTFLSARVIDVVIVDTLTGINHSRVRAFLTNMRRTVPYLIFLVQMRQNMNGYGMIPACSDTVLSSAHTHIYLTSSEKVTREGLDMRLVQFGIVKYEPDLGVDGVRESVIIRNNVVDNLYTAFHVLHARGRIRAYGGKKFLDGEEMPRYRDIARDPAEAVRYIELAWGELSETMITEPEAYVDRIPMPERMSYQDDTGDGTDSPGVQEEREDTHACGLPGS